MNGFRRLVWPSSVGRGSEGAVCRAVIVLTFFLATGLHGQSTWNNPGVGDWFNQNNWNPVGSPSATKFAAIVNGGEALAQLGGFPVVAMNVVEDENTEGGK